MLAHAFHALRSTAANCCIQSARPVASPAHCHKTVNTQREVPVLAAPLYCDHQTTRRKNGGPLLHDDAECPNKPYPHARFLLWRFWAVTAASSATQPATPARDPAALLATEPARLPPVPLSAATSLKGGLACCFRPWPRASRGPLSGSIVGY